MTTAKKSIFIVKPRGWEVLEREDLEATLNKSKKILEKDDVEVKIICDGKSAVKTFKDGKIPEHFWIGVENKFWGNFFG